MESVSLVSRHHSNETVTFHSTHIRSCVDAGDGGGHGSSWADRTAWRVVVRGEGAGRGLGSHRERGAADVFGDSTDGVAAAWFGAQAWAGDRHSRQVSATGAAVVKLIPPSPDAPRTVEARSCWIFC